MEEMEESAVKIEIEIESIPVNNSNENLFGELRESESVDTDSRNSGLQEIVSDMLCDTNSQEVNLATQSLDDHRPLSSAALEDNTTEASQNTGEYFIKNGILEKCTDMSMDVSIDGESSLERDAQNTADNAKSPSPETSSQPASTGILKSLLEGIDTGTTSPMDTIKSPTYKDIRSELSQLLRAKTLSAGSEKAKANPITIMKPPTYKDNKHGKVELYAPDTGPKIYTVKGNIVTPPIIMKNLPEVFKALPVHGKPEKKSELDKFYRQKIRDYVGYGLNDEEFKKLEKFCSPEHLKTGLELKSAESFPSHGPMPAELRGVPEENGPGAHLCIVKKLKLRLQKDKHNHYSRRLKYRGLRLLPLNQEDDEEPNETVDMSSTNTSEPSMDDPLEPGRDLIFRVRVYRPHAYGVKSARSNRHSVFNNDIVLLGRHNLTMLRDRIGCPNDIGMRLDMSDNPDAFITDSAKHVFPSGFLFINNVFYVDRRPGCSDQSAGIREWARRRRLGSFPVRDLATRLDRLALRLGHPEVYMHQGKCEHLFTFSEVRLLGAADARRPRAFPRHAAAAQNMAVYCTTCAEFGARWLVLGCGRVPFDPAFFCETCFKLYLYDRDGNKIGDFKAYPYKVNMVNFLKPFGGCPAVEYDQNAQEDGD